jgi:ABC-2 type transport system permease protein
MNRWLIVVGREYMTRVRKRAFIISTLLGPFLMVGVIAAILFIGVSSTEMNSKVLIVDHNNLLTYTMPGKGDVLLPSCPECFPERSFLEYRFASKALDTEAFLESEFTAMIELDDGIMQSAKALLKYESAAPMKVQSAVKRDLGEAIERLRVKSESTLDYDTYKKLKVRIGLVTQNIVTEDRNSENKSLIGFVFSVFMFMFIMIYGMHVMRGVIEEKSNRIVEVVISVVKPEHLMGAKIVGIGLVGLTQIAVWSLLSWLLFLGFGVYAETSGLLLNLMGEQGSQVASTDFITFIQSNEKLGVLLQVNWGMMLGWCAFFYLAGFALYASLFAAIGAAVEQESDAQYLLMPAMIPLMFSYIVNIFIIESPDSTLATFCSFFPFTSPITMMVKLSVGVPWWHVALSAIILILTVLLMVKLAGKIYRTGILMYGKKPSLKEMARWLMYKNR